MELIVVNGRIETMDARGTVAEAVGIRDGRIAALGSDVLAHRGPETTVIDAAGRTVLPGFIEPHNHMTFFATTLLQIDCRTPPNTSINDITDRVRERAATIPKGQWIRGFGYDDTGVTEMRHPNRRDLDSATTEHPVALTHNSGHMMAVNSAALALAGVTSETADLPGGRIGRFPGSAEPDGMLYETAQTLVRQHVPQFGEDEVWKAFFEAQAEYLRRGVTTMHDASVGKGWGVDNLALYNAARDNGEMKLRVNMFLRWDYLSETGFELRTGMGDEWVRVAGCKLFSDGSIQGLTAALREPYFCNEDEKGWLIDQQEELDEKVMTLHQKGYQIATHANGDAAIDAVLKAYEKALTELPKPDHRFRIEHCQVCHPEHIEAFRRLGVIPDFFANHVYYWGDRHRDRFLGPERVMHLDPVGSAVRAGLRPLLHSDCPVTPINPLFCVQSAVARITSSGQLLNGPERVSVREGIAAMTVNGAYGAFEEDTKGTLEVGKLGDLVVLEQDPFKVEPSEIGSIEVAATVVGGQVMHSLDGISIG